MSLYHSDTAHTDAKTDCPELEDTSTQPVEESAGVDDLHAAYDKLLCTARDEQFLLTKTRQRLAKSSLSGAILRWYFWSIGHTFACWVFRVRTQSKRVAFDIVMNADALRVQHEERLSKAEDKLKHEHQCRVLLHLRSTILLWKTKMQCSTFARWHHNIIIGRTYM